jgi:hypothetical protein
MSFWKEQLEHFGRWQDTILPYDRREGGAKDEENGLVVCFVSPIGPDQSLTPPFSPCSGREGGRGDERGQSGIAYLKLSEMLRECLTKNMDSRKIVSGQFHSGMVDLNECRKSRQNS